MSRLVIIGLLADLAHVEMWFDDSYPDGDARQARTYIDGHKLDVAAFAWAQNVTGNTIGQAPACARPKHLEHDVDAFALADQGEFGQWEPTP